MSPAKDWLARLLPGRGRTESTPAPGGSALPRHPSELWHVLQEIAREEDARFGSTSVLEHQQREGAEGGRDIQRWLEIYRRRVEPAREYRFPDHHPRYRGVCLIARFWARGLEWQAFDEVSLRPLPVRPTPDRGSLERAVDAYLETRAPGDPGATRAD